MDKSKLISLENLASNMRKDVIELAYGVGTKGAHIASSLSCIEILAVLYGDIMNYKYDNPEDEDRDRFILSKGHAALGLYTVLGELEIISKKEMRTFGDNDGFLPCQPSMNLKLGIEVSSGSLGHGLSLGIGIALAAKKQNKNYKTYVLMGDGECNEGTIWESAISAVNFRLNNLVVIIDKNNMQSDGKTSEIMDMGNLVKKWETFGFEVKEVDGHDISQIHNAFYGMNATNKPTAIIANTIKGKGISFMENNNIWHHNYLNDEQYKTAILELEMKNIYGN